MMFRNLLLVLCLLVFATPAMAYTTTWDGQPSINGTVWWNATVNGYIQVVWNQNVIAFNGSDWWHTTLTGPYAGIATEPDGKTPMDPWAGDNWYAATGLYYETGQGGELVVHSNCALTMTVTPAGLLTGASYGETLPSWYTAALAPFMIDDVTLNGTVPGSNGHYLYNGAGSVYAHGNDGGGTNYPTQHPFPFNDVVRSLSMDPEIEGTIKFLGRVHRHGMADRADDYATSLGVAFTSP